MRYKHTCPACGYSYEGIRADEDWIRQVYTGAENDELVVELLERLKDVTGWRSHCSFCSDVSTKSKTLMEETVLTS